MSSVEEAITTASLKTRALGLCMSCDTPAVPNGSRCEHHRTIHRQAQRAMKDRRHLNGLCVKCGLMPVKRFVRCHQCRARISEHNRRAYELRRDIATSLHELTERMRGLL